MLFHPGFPVFLYGFVHGLFMFFRTGFFLRLGGFVNLRWPFFGLHGSFPFPNSRFHFHRFARELCNPRADLLSYPLDLALLVEAFSVLQFIETLSKKRVYSIRVPVQMIPQVITIATE